MPSFKNEEHTVIDFQKFVRIHSSIIDALAYQRTEDASSRRVVDELRQKCRGPLEYLEGKLLQVKLDPKEDDIMKQKARDLAEKEAYDYNHRVTESEAAGFRVRRRA